MKMFKRTVPLWVLLFVLAVTFLCAVQIFSDINLHKEERALFIGDLRTYSEGIYLNLQNAYQDISDSEKVEESLIGAYLYSTDLLGLIYREPKYTLFGKEYYLFSDVDVPPNVVFPYLNSQLEKIRNEYLETGELSADSLSTIEILSTAFSEFYVGVGDEMDISQETFTERMNNLCSKIYPFR